MARAYSHDVLVMFNSGIFFFLTNDWTWTSGSLGQDIIFYDTFLHKHTPPGSSLTFLNTRGAQANVLIYRANLYTVLKDTGSYWGLPPRYRSIWSGSGRPESLLYFACAFTLTFLLSLNLFFFSVTVVTSASTLLEKVQEVMVQKEQGWNSGFSL